MNIIFAIILLVIMVRACDYLGHKDNIAEVELEIKELEKKKLELEMSRAEAS